MRKKLINIILVSCISTLLIGLAVLYGFRRQGRQRSLNLRATTAEVVEIRHQAGGRLIRLYRQGETWQLIHPAYARPVEADAGAVETLLDDLRHWEVAGLREAAGFEPDWTDGRLRVYARGGLLGRHKVWDGRWRYADSNLYLRDGRRLYSRLYDPRRAGEDGETALAADLTAAPEHWRNKWICHYYYYEIARAEWQDANAHFIYKANDGNATKAPDNKASTAEGTASANANAATDTREQALSAFRAVSFDRYATLADSLILRQAFTQPAHLCFSVFSKDGDSTFLRAYYILDAHGQADWFRLCGRLEKRGPQTPAPRTDTVFLSYQTLDRLKAAFSAMAAP